MTIRCGGCDAALRVREGTTGVHARGRCPKCGTAVALGAQGRIEVHCQACDARLMAPASSAGVRGRCPKCRAAVLIGSEDPAPSVAREKAAPAARAAAEAPEEGVSTQRISLNTLGMDAMASSFPPRSTEPPAKRREPVEESTSRATAPAAAALLDPPVASMTRAAEGIREAAESLGGSSPAPARPGRDGLVGDDFRDEDALDDEADAHRAATARKGEAAGAARDSDGAFPVQPAFHGTSAGRAMPAFQGATGLSTGQGLITGLLAGGIVGLIIAGAKRFVGEVAVEPFLAPAPAWLRGLELPDQVVTILLPAALGILVGLGASLSESPAGARAGRRFIRCAFWGMFVGAAMGAAWFLPSGNPPTLAGLSPAFNWVRDMMVAGILASLFTRFFRS